jgi:hypothetical protein
LTESQAVLLDGDNKEQEDIGHGGGTPDLKARGGSSLRELWDNVLASRSFPRTIKKPRVAYEI